MESTTTFYAFLFFISFLGVLISTPVISKIAVKNKIIDQPGFHKIHQVAKPLLGGIAIFIVFAGAIFVFLPMDTKILSLITATVILVTTGLLDDIYNIKPFLKLAGQTAASVTVVVWNRGLYFVMIDYFERFNIPEIVVLVLIIGWIVMMINAFNLIDGIDGLAVGTAAIIFLAMALLSVIEGGRPNILGVQLIGAGACLGFLIFNFNPAKIFMGDTGSMLLGFILATTHLFTIKYPFSAQLVLGSMFIFAYPALDISYTIFRRLCCTVSIFKADQGHIHHILLSLGFSVRKTVLLIYLANIIFAALAVVLLTLQIPAPFILLIGIATIIFVIILFIKLLTISRKNGIDEAS